MNRRRSLLALTAAALLLAPLSACAAGSGSEPAGDAIGFAPAPEVATDSSYAAEGQQKMSGADTVSGQSIIQSGDLTIVVADPAKSVEKVTAVAEKLGGYIESQSVSKAASGQPASAYLSVRVPTDKIDSTFEALAEVGNVTSENRTATDVTTEHVDLKARVAALEDSVKRLKELMSGAATTGELIEAETALSARQQELDGLKAQLKSLEGQVDEATIWVSLTTESVIPGGPSNFWEGILAGFASLGTAGAGALVVLGILIPWLVLGGIVALFVILIVRSRRRTKVARTVATRTEQRASQQPAGSAPAEDPEPTATP